MPIDGNILLGVAFDPASYSNAQRQLQNLSRRATVDLKVNHAPLGRINADLHEFDKSLQAANARVLAFGASTGAVYGIGRAFTEITKSFINIEAKFKSIQVVLNSTTAVFENFKGSIFAIGRDTGKSFEEVTDAAQELVRQGLKISETLQRTSDAMILSRQSGLSASEAVTSLTAALNTFNQEALTSTQVINKLANVDTNFAVSQKDLIDAISRSGSAAQDAGVQFDKLLSLTTSLQQTTARGGAVIGNALKSIFTRVQRSTTLEALEEFNIQTKDLQGNILSADVLLQNLAKTYKTLSTAEKSALSEQVAGIQQINQLKALLADLARANSVYSQALKTSSSSVNEAIDRNKSLNETLKATLNATKLNALEFSETVGKLALAPALKLPLGSANALFDIFKDKDQDSKGTGQKLGEGILRGIGSVLSGPGLVLATAIITNTLKELGRFTLSVVSDYSSLNNKTKEQINVQHAISQILSDGNNKYAARLAAAKSIKEQEAAIRLIMLEQNNIVARKSAMYAQPVRNIVSSGGDVTREGAFKLPKKAAGGYLPVYEEYQDIQRGVGGASRAAKPKVIPNFNFGGGKRGTIVANTDEYIVPNYAGGDGSAIFNPQMVARHGLPLGARKINASGGFVPNYAVDIPLTPIPRNAKHLNFPKKITVSDEDERLVSQYKWSVYQEPNGPFRIKTGKNNEISLSSILFGNVSERKLVSFKDGNPLNFQRDNVILDNASHGITRGMSTRSKLGRGVSRYGTGGSYKAQVYYDGNKLFSSIADNPESARDIYDEFNKNQKYLGSDKLNLNSSYYKKPLPVGLSFMNYKQWVKIPGNEKLSTATYREQRREYIRNKLQDRHPEYFSGGFVPNFNTLLGSGDYGSFYDLNRKFKGVDIGKKVFNADIGGRSGDPYLKQAYTEKHITDEFIAAKVLENLSKSGQLPPNVSAPQVFGTLEGALKNRSIYKQIVRGSTGGDLSARFQQEVSKKRNPSTEDWARSDGGEFFATNIASFLQNHLTSNLGIEPTDLHAGNYMMTPALSRQLGMFISTNPKKAKAIGGGSQEDFEKFFLPILKQKDNGLSIFDSGELRSSKDLRKMAGLAGGFIPNFSTYITPTKKLLKVLRKDGVDFNRWGESPNYRPGYSSVNGTLNPEIQIPKKNRGFFTGSPVLDLIHESGHHFSKDDPRQQSLLKILLNPKIAAQNERLGNEYGLAAMQQLNYPEKDIKKFAVHAQKFYETYARDESGRKRRGVPLDVFAPAAGGYIPNFADKLLRSEAIAKILAAKNKMFGAEFTKRTTGESRTGTFRLARNVKAGKVGGSLPYNAKGHKLVPVFDMGLAKEQGAQGSYRMLPYEGLNKLHIDGKEYDVVDNMAGGFIPNFADYELNDSRQYVYSANNLDIPERILARRKGVELLTANDIDELEGTLGSRKLKIIDPSNELNDWNNNIRKTIGRGLQNFAITGAVTQDFDKFEETRLGSIGLQKSFLLSDLGLKGNKKSKLDQIDKIAADNFGSNDYFLKGKYGYQGNQVVDAETLRQLGGIPKRLGKKLPELKQQELFIQRKIPNSNDREFRVDIAGVGGQGRLLSRANFRGMNGRLVQEAFKESENRSFRGYFRPEYLQKEFGGNDFIGKLSGLKRYVGDTLSRKIAETQALRQFNSLDSAQKNGTIAGLDVIETGNRGLKKLLQYGAEKLNLPYFKGGGVIEYNFTDSVSKSGGLDKLSTLINSGKALRDNSSFNINQFVNRGKGILGLSGKEQQTEFRKFNKDLLNLRKYDETGYLKTAKELNNLGFGITVGKGRKKQQIGGLEAAGLFKRLGFSEGYIPNFAPDKELQRKFIQQFYKAKRSLQPEEGYRPSSRRPFNTDELGARQGGYRFLGADETDAYVPPRFEGLSNIPATPTTVSGSINAITSRVPDDVTKRQLLRLSKEFDYGVEDKGNNFLRKQVLEDNRRFKSLIKNDNLPESVKSNLNFSRKLNINDYLDFRKDRQGPKSSDYLFRGVGLNEITNLRRLGQVTSLGASNADGKLGTFITSSFGKSAGFGLSEGGGYTLVLDKKRILGRPTAESIFGSEEKNTIKAGRITKDDVLGIVDLKTRQVRSLEEFSAKNQDLLVQRKNTLGTVNSIIRTNQQRGETKFDTYRRLYHTMAGRQLDRRQLNSDISLFRERGIASESRVRYKDLKSILENPDQDILNTSTRNYAGGFVPNFNNPLISAIARERAAGLPLSQIRVENHPSLISNLNPGGLAVTNQRDEPAGITQGISRALKEGRDPKKYGAAKGLIPNFAPSFFPDPTFTEGTVKALGMTGNVSPASRAKIKDFTTGIKLSEQDLLLPTQDLRKKIQASITQAFKIDPRFVSAAFEKGAENIADSFVKAQKTAMIKAYQKNLKAGQDDYVRQELVSGVTDKINRQSSLLFGGFKNKKIISSVENSPEYKALSDKAKLATSSELQNLAFSNAEQRNSKLQSKALSLSFGLPVVTGALLSQLNPNDPKSKKFAGIAEGVSTGLSVAAIGGFSPLAVGAGLVLGGGSIASSLAKSRRKSPEQLSEELTNARGKFESSRNAVLGTFQGQDALKEAIEKGSSLGEVRLLSRQITDSISGIEESSLRNKVIAAKTDEERANVIDEINKVGIQKVSRTGLASKLEESISPSRGILSDYFGDTKSIVLKPQDIKDIGSLVAGASPLKFDKDGKVDQKQLAGLQELSKKGDFNIDEVEKVLGNLQISRESRNQLGQFTVGSQKAIAKDVVERQLSIAALDKNNEGLVKFNNLLLRVGKTLDTLSSNLDFKFKIQNINTAGIRDRAISGASQSLGGISEFLSPELRNKQESLIAGTQIENQRISTINEAATGWVKSLRDLENTVPAALKGNDDGQGGEGYSAKGEPLKREFREILTKVIANGKSDPVSAGLEGLKELKNLNAKFDKSNDPNGKLKDAVLKFTQGLTQNISVADAVAANSKASLDQTTKINELIISLQKSQNFLGGGTFESSKDLDFSKIQSSSRLRRQFKDDLTSPFRDRIYKSRGNSFDDFFQGKQIDEKAETARRASNLGTLASGSLQLSQLGLLDKEGTQKARLEVAAAEKAQLENQLNKLEEIGQTSGDFNLLDSIRNIRKSGIVNDAAATRSLKQVPLLAEEGGGDPLSKLAELSGPLGDLSKNIVNLNSNFQTGVQGDFTELSKQAYEAAKELFDLSVAASLSKENAENEKQAKSALDKANLIKDKQTRQNELKEKKVNLSKNELKNLERNTGGSDKTFSDRVDRNFTDRRLGFLGLGSGKGLEKINLGPNPRFGISQFGDPDREYFQSNAASLGVPKAGINEILDSTVEINSFNSSKTTKDLVETVKRLVSGDRDKAISIFEQLVASKPANFNNVGKADSQISGRNIEDLQKGPRQILERLIKTYNYLEKQTSETKSIDDEISTLDREIQELSNKSRGLIPNYSMGSSFLKEKRDIAKGVGGARPGDSPYITHLAGVGPAVVNTGEKIIRNFAGGGKDAVFNRKMMNFAGGLSFPIYDGKEKMNLSDNRAPGIYENGKLISASAPTQKQNSFTRPKNAYERNIGSVLANAELNGQGQRVSIVGSKYGAGYSQFDKGGGFGKYRNSTDYINSEIAKGNPINPENFKPVYADEDFSNSLTANPVNSSGIRPARTIPLKTIAETTKDQNEYFKEQIIEAKLNNSIRTPAKYKQFVESLRNGSKSNLSDFAGVTEDAGTSSDFFGNKFKDRSTEFNKNFLKEGNNGYVSLRDKMDDSFSDSGSPFQDSKIQGSGGLGSVSLQGPQRFGGSNKSPDQLEKHYSKTRRGDDTKFDRNTTNTRGKDDRGLIESMNKLTAALNSKNKPADGDKPGDIVKPEVAVKHDINVNVVVGGEVNTQDQRVKDIIKQETEQFKQNVENRIKALENKNDGLPPPPPAAVPATNIPK